jgi:DNA polymerase III delta prime subunit
MKSKVYKNLSIESKPIYSFYNSVKKNNIDDKTQQNIDDKMQRNILNNDNCSHKNEVGEMGENNKMEYKYKTEEEDEQKSEYDHKNEDNKKVENIIIKSSINVCRIKDDNSCMNDNILGINNNELFKNSTPWVEKYRPSCFEDIVLDPLNKILLKNIIDNNYFPNLLFYGPPGTGKTTTIINLVNVYQEKMNLKNKGLMIHLNASDERGIDIIRNQINSFVNSKSLFGNGMKFVILDEVDYMTKTAQIALRYLLNNYNNNFNVRFCLICNYISRIDESLQTEFVRMRFNQLPENDILKFLKKINESENLKIKDDILISIQKHFMSDIRSMINYMQSNQDLIHECKIIKNDLWVKLTQYLKKNTNNKKNDSILKKINKISRDYNIEPKNIIKNYLNYIIRNYDITSEFLYNIENIMHVQDCKTEHLLNYIIYKLKLFFTSPSPSPSPS